MSDKIRLECEIPANPVTLIHCAKRLEDVKMEYVHEEMREVFEALAQALRNALLYQNQGR